MQKNHPLTKKIQRQNRQQQNKDDTKQKETIARKKTKKNKDKTHLISSPIQRDCGKD